MENLTYFILSIANYCFGFGLFGLLRNNRNLLLILVALELVLLGLSCYFIFFSFYLAQITGQIIALAILTLAGAESALGLALMMVLYRVTRTIDIRSIAQLKN